MTESAGRNRMGVVLVPVWTVLMLAWSLTGCQTVVAPPGKTVRLLTVGNSFSRNATTYLGEIAKADGNRLVHSDCIIWGGSISQHWARVECLERDPNDPAGRLFLDKTLPKELGAAPWDYITIQQASFLSFNETSYRPYAARLHAYLKSRAPQAEILMHQTWAYRCDDPWFTGQAKPGEPASQKAMYEGLDHAYATLAAELGIRRIPAGAAMYAVDRDPSWGYRPDPAFNPDTAKPQALPDQRHSLHVGYFWKKGTNNVSTLEMDGHHAGVAGQYLAGCVFYEMLFNRSVIGNSFRPKGLSREEVAYLQAAAHWAVLAERK